LIINIKKSILLTSVVLGAHVGVWPLVFVLHVPTALKIGLAGLIGASLGWQWHRGALVAPGELKLGDDGNGTLTGEGRAVRGGRVACATLHAFFVRLTFEHASAGPRTLLIMQDALEPEAYRELRARVTQGRLPVRDATTT
jgi:hypothetical protein